MRIAYAARASRPGVLPQAMLDAAPIQPLTRGRCPECGYGLKGLPLAGGGMMCPECGTLSRLSEVLGQLPPFSRTWLLLMHCGPMFLLGLGAVAASFAGSLAGVVMLLVLTLLAGLLFPLALPFAAGKRIPGRGRGRWIVTTMMLTLLCNALQGVVIYVAVWLSFVREIVSD